ncbi:NHL repeat-containing protein [Bdellovibrio bacteriovorus]|uniref:NHL repeat-containing protein n=1 Tax=Bdellovibrio bacteriovorus TaxID=959 RepID=UPI0035A740DA
MADRANHVIRKITPGGVVTTLAGKAGVSGSADGAGSAARFNAPRGIAIDSGGTLYVSDWSNHTIRKITSAGVVTTFAGLAGNAGSTDGTGSTARFNGPQGIALDSSGNVYVSASNAIRKITSGGAVTTLAGSSGISGFADGTGSAARFNFLDGIAVDSGGNLYVADRGNHVIRKVAPGGVVTTFAGSAGVSGSLDGTGSAARFYNPQGISVDGSGNLFVTDSSNSTIRKITSAGVVTTMAGLAGSADSTDGTGFAARFSAANGIAVDGSGNIFVADEGNHTIRKITSGGVVTTLAGLAGGAGSADDTGSAARFNAPVGMAMDSGGNIYVADRGNHVIRKITSAGEVTTLAGLSGTWGTTNGTGSGARFSSPYGVAVDSSGNLFVTDSSNHTIRKITSAGVVTTIAGLAGSIGYADGAGSSARFFYPDGVAVDNSGNIYVADTYSHTIRKITSDGVVTTLAGLGGNPGSTDGTGAAARFNYPTGVAVDNAGNVYVADRDNHVIRKITSGGVVTTIAGLAGSSGAADGTGPAARFNSPSGIAIDSGGNIFVADTYNYMVRKITPAGLVTTVVGKAGDFGNYTDFLPASLGSCRGLVIREGRIFISSENAIFYSTGP